jgi:hypothetical protein
VKHIADRLFNAWLAHVNVHRMKPRLNGPLAAIALCASTLLLASACTRSADDVRAVHAGGKTPAAAAVARLKNDSDADMVAAVSDDNSGTPVFVSYRLTARPQLNQPLDVEVAITPDKRVKVLTMHLSFRGGDGLELRSAPRVEIADAGAEEVFRQTVSVVPTVNGVLQLHLTALVDSTADSLARSYAIPVVVAANTAARGEALN